jgi:hypothetical protein
VRTTALLAVLFLAGCRGVTPLGSKLSPGEEPLLVVVGEGGDGQTDLFVGSPGGGAVARLTFTRDREFAPALHPSGLTVAFLRRAAAADRPVWLVVLNLLNAAEREVELPAQLGDPERLAWSRDGQSLWVRGTGGTALTPAPPAPFGLAPLAADDPRMADADTALSLELGRPPIGKVVACPTADTAAGRWCAALTDGTFQPLGALVRDPFAWGTDSLGYFEGDRLMVRSLAGGRPRPVAWSGVPLNLRQASYVPGPIQP